MSIRLPTGCLVVLVGPSGAGKTTWAEAHFRPEQIVSSDRLRALVGEGPYDQRAGKDAFDVLDLVLARRAARRLLTVVDTLGLDPARRAAYLAVARRHGMACHAVVIDTPAARCRERNRARERPVPAKVLADQLRAMSGVRTALPDEGFDAIHDATDDAINDAGPAATGDAGRDASRAATGDAGRDASRAAPVDTGPDATRATPVDIGPDATPVAARDAGQVQIVPAGMLTAPAAAARQRAEPAALRFGLHVPSFTWAGDSARLRVRLGELAVAAERAGFSSLWVMDHVLQIPQVGREWDPMLDSYTTLGFLAAATRTCRIGALVTGVTYRNPAHLAKIVATLDALSGGRAVCGLGAAWFEREHRAYGWDFPDRRERLDLLEDALRLLPLMWGPGSPPFDGHRLHVPQAICYPRPLQPHVPILVGGQGERRTLRLVAQYADACNLFGSPGNVRQKLYVLRAHCRDAGRSMADIEVTHLSTVLCAADEARLRTRLAAARPKGASPESYAESVHAGTVEDHVGRFRELAEAGVHTAIVGLADLAAEDAVSAFAPVIDAFGG